MANTLVLCWDCMQSTKYEVSSDEMEMQLIIWRCWCYRSVTTNRTVSYILSSFQFNSEENNNTKFVFAYEPVSIYYLLIFFIF